MKQLVSLLLAVPVALASISAFGDNAIIQRFPIEHYPQQVAQWVNMADTKPVMTKPDLQAFRQQWLQAWSKDYVQKLLDGMPQQEQDFLKSFDNQNNQCPTGKDCQFGMNFQPLSQAWWQTIQTNMQLAASYTYNPVQLAVMTRNEAVRVLPTTDQAFNSWQQAGQGFPFDNLQNSAIWLGTPVYVVQQSRDRQWSLVISPAMFYGWVRSDGVAFANPSIVDKWRNSTGLSALLQNHLSLPNPASSTPAATGFLGTVLPADDLGNGGLQVYYPVKNADGSVFISHAILAKDRQAAWLPWPATPQHFGQLFQQTIGRQYGWGGVQFYNDCSAETRNVFKVFGVWLPRNSMAQDLYAPGQKTVVDDKTGKKGDSAARIQYLHDHGTPYTTLVFIGGHIMLYIGNHDTKQSPSAVMTVQNLWGLHPTQYDARVVIGQNAFFPLLNSYPEGDYISLADKTYFDMIDLSKPAQYQHIRLSTAQLAKLAGIARN